MNQLSEEKPRSMASGKGFTLVEVMIVVVIVGILAVIGLLQYNRYQAKALNTAALTDLRHLRMELEGFYAENQHYPH